MTLGAVVIFIIVTLLTWLFVGIIRLVRKKRSNKDTVKRLTKWVGIIYGLTIVMLFVTVIINGGVDPVYQLPKEAYGMASENILLENMMTYFILLTTFGLVASSIFLWLRKRGHLLARIHYTLYSGTAIFFVLILYYWNLL